jgi:glycosyltransferase involved in cell wall biosynthesis
MENNKNLINKVTDLTFSILVVSKSSENVSQLLSTISSSINIDLKLIEVLCSWNGLKTDEEKILIPKGISFEIVNRDPYHFASNINKLSEFAKGVFIIIANDDISLKPNTLFNSLKYLNHDSIGIVGSILLFPNGKIQHCGISFKEDFTPFHIDKGATFNDSKCSYSPRVVEACTGALFFCKRKIFSAIKMHETFKECGEDICFSIDVVSKSGLSVVVPNDVIAEHAEGHTRAEMGRQGTPPIDLQNIKEHVDKYKKQKITVSIKTEEKGWIFYRKAEEIQKNLLDCEILINEESDDSADIVYFIHYARFNEKIVKNKISIANFTHYVPGTNAEPLFKAVAHKVDHCIAVSESTRRDLHALGVSDDRITVIEVGAAKEFKPKVVIGVVGRIYNDGRKGEDFVKKLMKDKEVISLVDLIAMDNCWGCNTINIDSSHLFYSLIDYLLVPSRVEGGPVPFMEALACGKLAIAPPIGVIPSFPHIEYEVGNYESLKTTVIETAKKRIAELKVNSSYIVEKNWERWAFEHHLVFAKTLQTLKQKEFVKSINATEPIYINAKSTLAYANALYQKGQFDSALLAYKKLVADNKIPEHFLRANIKMAEKKMKIGMPK